MEQARKRRMIVGLACLLASVLLAVGIPCIQKDLIRSAIQDDAPIEEVSCRLKYSLFAVIVGGVFAVSGIALLWISIPGRNSVKE